jgi:PIN domain nuclease of toxin-antitoxin system
MILADTHIVLWLALEPALLSPAASSALTESRESRGGVAIASVTLWEIAMATRSGKLQLETPLGDFLRSVEETYSVLQMTAPIAERGMKFSKAYPRDPADRMIGATALVHGLRLVTRDEVIQASGEVPVVW